MSNYKLLAIGDIHCKANNVRDCRILEEKLNILLRKVRVNDVVLLGDFGDGHDRMNLHSWISIVRLSRLISRFAHLWIIIGNHDVTNNREFLTKDHFFAVFSRFGIENITIVDEPKILDLYWGNILMVPYVPPGRFLEAIKTTDRSLESFKCIFAHQEFYGAQLGVKRSEVGDKYPIGGPPVFSGHIHGRGHPNNQKNITYLDTPMNNSFGESNTSTVSLFSIDSNTGALSEQIINLGMPKRITIDIDVADFHGLKLDDGNHYRINISGKKEQLSKLQKTDEYKIIKEKAKVNLKPAEEYVDRKQLSTKSFFEILNDQINKDTEAKRELEVVEKLVKGV